MTHTLEHQEGTTTRDRHTLVDLVRELRDETTLLLRQEALLLRREMEQKVDHFKRSSIAMLSGAALAALGSIFLLLAASNGLTTAYVEMGMDADVAIWLGPLTVGVIVGLGGALLAWGAFKRLQHEDVTPHKTIESLEETGQWAKQKVKQI